MLSLLSPERRSCINIFAIILCQSFFQFFFFLKRTRNSQVNQKMKNIFASIELKLFPFKFQCKTMNNILLVNVFIFFIVLVRWRISFTIFTFYYQLTYKSFLISCVNSNASNCRNKIQMCNLNKEVKEHKKNSFQMKSLPNRMTKKVK